MAVTVTRVDAVTVPTVTVWLAVVWPAGTVKLAGTVNTVMLVEVKLIVAPPARAAALRVTVNVAVLPLPTKLEGVTEKLVMVGNEELTVTVVEPNLVVS